MSGPYSCGLEYYFCVIMEDHAGNFEVAVLSMIYALVRAAKLVIENDVAHYDANNEIPYDATRERGPTTRNHRMDNLFNHIECVRNEIERMFREYRVSLDSARDTILVAIRQAENGTRPLSVSIADRPLIVASQPGQELHATSAREIVDQVFGDLTSQVRWVPFHYEHRLYLARRPYRIPGTIYETDEESLFSDAVSESE